MRLPIANEAKAWTTGGVPSCSNRTWTSTYDPNYYSGGYKAWFNTTIYSLDPDNPRNVRCVR